MDIVKSLEPMKQIREMFGSVERCINCSVPTPIDYFKWEKNKGLSILSPLFRRKSALCPICLQTAKDIKKRANRAKKKAGNTRYDHSKKLGIPVAVLQAKYGWDLNTMAHDAMHAYENMCPDCRNPFKEMDHGLADVSLDITDVNGPPFYGINTRWICKTCNGVKQRRGVEEYGRYINWVRWREIYLQTHEKPVQLILNIFGNGDKGAKG